MKILFILLLTYLSLSANWKTERQNLDQFFQQGEFRAFYTLKGKNAIKNQTDINENNIPDIVENVILQFNVSDEIFKDVLGFKSPLQQKIYKQKKVKFIDVHFLKMSSVGRSGDAAIFYNYKVIKNKHKALSIAISNEIKLGNLTPIHELFHSYQNGYTLFKNSWYTEGTARWSEDILRKGIPKQNKLPSSIKDIENVLSKTYGTKYFWNRLAKIITTDTKNYKIPNKFLKITYIGTDRKVVEDNLLFGSEFMIKFLENLDFYDDKVSKLKGYDPYDWKESNQKGSFNTKYILLAIKKTIKDINPKQTKEIKKFIYALDLYVEKLNKP